MRTLVTAALMLIGSIATTSTSAANTIDFGAQQIGTIDGSLDFTDASFSSSTGRLFVGASGGSHAICPLNGAHCVATLTVTFASPVDNLSFLANGDNNASSSVFVSGMSTSGAFSFTGGSFDGVLSSFATIDLSAFGGITSIAITNNDPAGLGYDFFSFETLSEGGSGSTVPEPAAWALMLAGFGLVGSAMRRRSPAFSVLA